MRKCPNCKENTISYWKLIAGNAWENIECSNCKNTVKISLKWNVIIGIPLFIAGWLIISVYNAGHRNEFIFGDRCFLFKLVLEAKASASDALFIYNVVSI